MYVSKEDSEEEQVLEIWPNSQPWAHVKEICHSKAEIEFKIKLRVAPEDEIPFEDTEPPPTISALLAQTTPENPTTTDQPAVVTGMDDSKTTDFLTAIDSSRMSNSTGLKPRPRKGEAVEAFIARHDGFDVRKPQDLLRWQLQALEGASGSQPQGTRTRK